MQIDPENMLLLEQHLACASAESYLQLHSDQQYFGSKIFKAADTLISEGKTCLCLVVLSCLDCDILNTKLAKPLRGGLF